MKGTQTLENWLKHKQSLDRAGAVLTGLGLALAAGAVLFVTFWVVYIVIFIGFQWLLPHSHETRLAMSGVVLLLLFIGNATVDRHYLNSVT